MFEFLRRRYRRKLVDEFMSKGQGPHQAVDAAKAVDAFVHGDAGDLAVRHGPQSVHFCANEWEAKDVLGGVPVPFVHHADLAEFIASQSPPLSRAEGVDDPRGQDGRDEHGEREQGEGPQPRQGEAGKNAQSEQDDQRCRAEISEGPDGEDDGAAEHGGGADQTVECEGEDAHALEGSTPSGEVNVFADDPVPPHDHDKGGRIKWTDDLNAWLARHWTAGTGSAREIADALGIGEGTVYLRCTKTLGLAKRGAAAIPVADPVCGGGRSAGFSPQPGDMFAATEVEKIKDMYFRDAEPGAIAATLSLPPAAVAELVEDKVARGIWKRPQASPGFRVVDHDLADAADDARPKSVSGESSRVVHPDDEENETVAAAIRYLEVEGMQVQKFKGRYDVLEGTSYLEECLNAQALIEFANMLRIDDGLDPFAAA